MNTRGAVLLTLLITGAAMAQDGRLCVGDECRDAKRTVVPIDASASTRAFQWMSTSGKEIIAGALPAGATKIDLTAPPSLRFQVTSSDDRQWPAPLRVSVGTTDWTLPAGDTTPSIRMLGIPPGTHALRIGAEHHRDAERSVTIGERPADAGRIVLERHPVLAGRIVRLRGGDGVVGATIALPSNEIVATVEDPSGDFVAEIDGEWPETVRVSYPGYGTRIVTVPRIAADADLGLVQLSVAATLRVSLDFPQRGGRVHAELSVVEQYPRRVASQLLPPEESDLTFRDLAPGAYLLLIRGDGPFERFTKELTLAEAESHEASVKIRPVAINLGVTHRGSHVAGAALQVNNIGAQWQADVVTDDEGRYSGTLWQHGDLIAMVTVAPYPSTASSDSFASGDVDWTIALPDQEIAGTIVDAVHGRGIPGASIFISTDDDTSSSLVRLKTDESGRFVAAFSRPGRHTVTARADGFMAATTSFSTSKEDKERGVRLALARGTERVLRVRSASGVPIAGALVVDEQGLMGANAFTDAEGIVRMTVPQGQTKSFYVLPKEGSFAIVAVDDRADGDVVATVAPGDASIVVRTQDETLTSVPNVSVMMRFNGHFLPMPVTVAMMQHQGRSFTTASYGKLVLEHMPAGLYDLWPYFSQAEARAIRIGPDAPARIAAQPGPNAVTLTFARANRTNAP